jgi:hypothetical protein
MVGGNLIEYPGDVSTPTAYTTMAKMVMNSTIQVHVCRHQGQNTNGTI